ncbi:carboxymuconolactone decarboxylase family protein [Roseomonas sp. TAS13]|uniref:carboxymuconolactone decarboxylase family protein n=1 Tax=Roseomonas TaxID=125216 RepID=UPI00095A221D|nr:carboxymuconolactone decarboxylase family protein [Roseomonas sp. TAS13]GAV34058.1 carboxymuconolactone decarboxylase family protein [Roseomonas sp. TAS13]
MTDAMYPAATRETAQKRRELAPETQAAFDAFSRQAFAEGALSAKMKQIVAVAVAHATQCPYCIKGHTKAALRAGATREELMEAIWVATEMRAGGAYAHSILALTTFEEEEAKQKGPSGG